MNPLQQAPTPASPLGGPAEFALGPLGADEGAPVSTAVARGIAISPHKLNDFAKVVRGLHIEDALIQVRL